MKLYSNKAGKKYIKTKEIFHYMILMSMNLTVLFFIDQDIKCQMSR